MRRLAGFLLFVSFATAVPAQITSESLLGEMTDMRKLAHRPKPYYTTAQASSYDRASVKAGSESWFANGDAGQFVRVEDREGRKERVMADLKGPGAVVRIWSANPGGTMRFYFDGEDSPRIVEKAQDLLGGKVAPWNDPFAYIAARGWNLYAPFPYSKSLKITVDDSDKDASRSMYYEVGYRTYEPGTAVTTFDKAALKVENYKRMGNDLLSPGLSIRPVRGLDTNLNVMPKASTVWKVGADKGGSEIVALWVKIQKPWIDDATMAWTDPRAPRNVLRDLIMEISFDGETTVRAPIGDLFSTVAGIRALKQLPLTVTADGRMECRFVMPFKSNATFTLRNLGSQAMSVSMGVAKQPAVFDDGTYYFHAQWSGEKGSTRPMRDMSYLKVAGEGCWIGSNMHVSNPVPAWWGEGDEKVFVDGEAFPSTFGTGTEDYYGYAWCDPTPFQRPYHAQPSSGKPGNFGHTNVNRWHILDPIHFKSSFQFDMEMWHWAVVDATFVRTSYWYARPGGTPLAALNTSLLRLPELVPAAPVKGALEGESFKVVSTSGGETEKQEGFFETSSGAQLWWRDAPVGSKLVLTFPVASAGKYKVIGNFCMARDYGIHRLTVNGKVLEPIDFYSDGLAWKKIDLGVFDLPKGEVKLEVEVTGTNPASNPKRQMFGLDYLKLEKA